MDFLPENLKESGAVRWDEVFSALDPLIRSVVRWSKWHFSPDVQEELAQDIRTDLLTALAKFRGEANLEHYVKRICVHHCYDRVARQIKERQLFVSLTSEEATSGSPVTQQPSTDFDPVQTILGAERITALALAMQQLDETCRKAIRLFYNDGLPYAEISQLLDITVNTVGSRLAKCLAKLRVVIQKNELLGEYFGLPSDKSL